MKVQYASDLHIEFPHNSSFLHREPIKPVGEILILAGDVGFWNKETFEDGFFDYIAHHFQQVYYLPGNHEFYNGQDIKVIRKPVCETIREMYIW